MTLVNSIIELFQSFLVLSYMYLIIIKCEYRYSNQNRLFYQRIHLCPGTEKNVFCKLVIGRNMCDIPLGKKCDKTCGFCKEERQHESVLDCCKAKQVPRLCLGMCIDRKMPFKNILRFAGVKCSKHSKNVISCKEEHKGTLSSNPKHPSLRQDSLVNCGNGSYQYSCRLCQGIGEPASWCSNDCEWNNFWQECREKGENTYDVETQALGRGLRNLVLKDSYENKMCCAMNSFDSNIFDECQNHPLNECVGFEISGYRTRCESLGVLVEDSYGFKFGGICVPEGISCNTNRNCPILFGPQGVKLSSYCGYYDNSCRYYLEI